MEEQKRLERERLNREKQVRKDATQARIMADEEHMEKADKERLDKELAVQQSKGLSR